MKQVRVLTEDETTDLEHLHRQGATHRERVRAHAVLLSAKGFSLETLSTIFSSDRDTISDWLSRFEQGGIAALRDAPKPGRPAKLTAQAEVMLRQSLVKPSPNLKPLLLQRLKKGA